MRKKIIAAIIIIFALAYLSPYAISAFDGIVKDNQSIPAFNFECIAQKRKIKKDDYIYFGRYMGEPIIWKCVKSSPDEIVLLSEKILCFKSFDAACDKCAGHEKTDTQRFGTAEYQYSAIKSWLNSTENKVEYNFAVPASKNIFMGKNPYDDESGFLCDKNFSKSQREIISCAFLPSKKEFSLLSQKERRKVPTQSAIKNDESSFIVLPSMRVWYWTSSDISTNNVSVSTITSSGTFYKAMAFDSSVGVCPALKLNSNELLVFGGGSFKNPYVYFEEAENEK